MKNIILLIFVIKKVCMKIFHKYFQNNIVAFIDFFIFLQH